MIVDDFIDSFEDLRQAALNGIFCDEINVIDLPKACKRENKHVDEYLRLIKLLR